MLVRAPKHRLAKMLALVCALGCLAAAWAQPALPITPPRQAFGFNIGDDYFVANYTQLESYWKRLDAESDRMVLTDIGPTAEGRRQYMAIVSSPANLARLDLYKSIAERLAHAENLTADEARALARAGKTVVWIDGGQHANETAGSQQLIEMVYQMVSRTDEETLRFLDDVIQLYVPANPDGQELVANWYMREADPLRRSLSGIPRLYQKYTGHDDNRDFFLSSMPETTNVNRQLFQEWFPQIVYNHHQTGPTGTVVFIPPFRDPYNYNLDPLLPLGIEMVGTAMHTRLIEEGKPGSVMRNSAPYSAWWNGGLRTIANFHNMIGILTEISGSPTPIDISLVPERQLPGSDGPSPAVPGKWHFRQTIDYEIEQNRAVLDYASRYRETLLMDIYRMGRNSIERGSRDSWTITPKRISALRSESQGGRFPAELYDTVLHDPRYRDPRGYIVSANQPDFPTAIKFVNALLKTGVTVLRATSDFRVAGKGYSAGSFVVKTAQAFRPHVLDMFEPQDYPNDVPTPGGQPVPPYDIAGWTLALQMGVQFDRILDGFDGPFEPVRGLATPQPSMISGSPKPGAYCVGHATNDAFIAVNRLLRASREVLWFENGGDFCTDASDASREILQAATAEFGIPARALDRMPSGAARKLKQPRVGLYDQYGGLAPSGWTRWLLEQFEFPYEIVYPRTLNSGRLREHFDVLLFTDEAYTVRNNGFQPRAETIPAEYRGTLGRITMEQTVPQLKTFTEAGGTLLTLGSSTALASLVGVPVTDHLTAPKPDGTLRTLQREEFYTPGSLLRVNIDTRHPLAHGMPQEAVVFFDSSPVFRANSPNVKPIASYGPQSLVSGWSLGQQHLAGGIAVADAQVGEGHVIIYGPEVAFRAQPHGTFKLLFNGIFYGSGERVTLP
jgi:hypothetical protein